MGTTQTHPSKDAKLGVSRPFPSPFVLSHHHAELYRPAARVFFLFIANSSQPRLNKTVDLLNVFLIILK